ncbi:hypothetical protein CF121_06435, partial [Aeromonas media]
MNDQTTQKVPLQGKVILEPTLSVASETPPPAPAQQAMATARPDSECGFDLGELVQRLQRLEALLFQPLGRGRG